MPAVSISLIDTAGMRKKRNVTEKLEKLSVGDGLRAVKFAEVADYVAVMYLGVIVELAGRDELYSDPQHPYTQALLSAVPIPDPHATRARKRVILEGDPPSPADPPAGCRFHPRCSLAQEHCRIEIPIWREIKPNHWVACHEC